MAVPIVVVFIVVVIAVAVAIAAYYLLKYRKNKKGKCNMTAAAFMRCKRLGREARVRERSEK